MKPIIGIVGGAGPLAGAFLLERIFSLAGKIYGCSKDADFPKIFLISFPFSEMLDSTLDFAKLQQELSGCLKQLRKNGASILGIACNTLHAFLAPKDDSSDLIHLPRLLAENGFCKPLVFCTSTSAQFGLHNRFFPCIYPGKKVQEEIDGIIDEVLKGADKLTILSKLKPLIQAESADTIILGCTELPIFSAELTVPNKQIIDPLELMANRILEKFFSNNARQLK